MRLTAHELTRASLSVVEYEKYSKLLEQIGISAVKLQHVTQLVLKTHSSTF